MPNSVRPRTSEAGFSLVEGLVAAALLLIVTVGILPLFSRAMQNNAKGNDSTRQANGAVDELERSISMPFNSGPMDVVNGTNQTVETRVIALRNPPETITPRWELPADLGPNDRPVTTRQRTLRQFSFDDLTDNQQFDSPLAGDVEDRLVQFKVVDLVIDDPAKPLSRPYRLRLIQAF